MRQLLHKDMAGTMIHRRWLFFIGAIVCGVAAGLLFSFQQTIAGVCIILMTGILAIAFVTSPNAGEPDTPLPTAFVVMNPQRVSDVGSLEYIETRQ